MTLSRTLCGLAVASALLLSGCGVAGTGFHPGVAARVGDDSISLDRVNEVSSAYCEAIKGQLEGNKQVLPQRYLRGGVAGQLALVSAAEQLAAEQGVEAGTEYDRKVAELEAAVTDLPEDQQEAVLAIESSATYLTAVLEAVGRQLLAEEGQDVTVEAAANRGHEALVAWLAAHEVSIDPQFGVELEEGQAVPTDTSLSTAVGTTAKNGQAASPDQQYAAGLPAAHRCGA